MTKKNMLMLSIVSLLVSLAILLLLIFAENLQTQSMLQDRVFYISLVLMGIFSALALFGYIKSRASLSGNVNGMAIELGGPAALAALVVIGGFFLIPRDQVFDVTVRAVDKLGVPVYSDRKAEVLLKLPTGLRTADFTSNGEATIKGIPAKLLNTRHKIIVDIYFYTQSSPEKEYILNHDVIEVPLLHNEGTEIGILNQKKAHLEFVKLLIPFRLINGNTEKLEMDLDQYYAPSFVETAQRIELNTKINLSDDEKYRYFDILYEYAPESLNFNGKTYAELIHETAISFRRNISVMSQIDSEGIDPKLQRELIKVSRANFVVIAAGERAGSTDGSYINEGFWNDFTNEIKRIHENNVINLFTEFSDF